MANPNNRFASAKNFTDLEHMFEGATSPENLMADGERSRADAQVLHDKLMHDYLERDEELIQEHNLNYPM